MLALSNGKHLGEALIHHGFELAVYLLFLYSPIPLYAANKAVAFVPYVSGLLNLTETSVTDQHWSVRK